jgi:hypothetical protein
MASTAAGKWLVYPVSQQATRREPRGTKPTQEIMLLLLLLLRARAPGFQQHQLV